MLKTLNIHYRHPHAPNIFYCAASSPVQIPRHNPKWLSALLNSVSVSGTPLGLAALCASSYRRRLASTAASSGSNLTIPTGYQPSNKVIFEGLFGLVGHVSCFLSSYSSIPNSLQHVRKVLSLVASSSGLSNIDSCLSPLVLLCTI